MKGVNYLFLLTLLLITGCASLGPVYSKADKIPDNSGLVYFYRPSSFYRYADSYDIKNDNTVITTLYNGGYYPYFSTPGEKEFWTKKDFLKISITLDVKAGQTYYVKGEIGPGLLLARPHLMVVTPEIAEKEIADCKLIPDKK